MTVTWRRLHEPIVAMEFSYYVFLVCVGSLSCYPTCKARAPYYVAPFTTLSYKWQRFSGWKLWNIKCVFLLSLWRLSVIFLILRKIQPDSLQVCRHSCSAAVILSFLSDFNQIWIFSTNFRNKSSNTKRRNNLSNRANIFFSHAEGRTDRHEDVKKSHFAVLWTSQVTVQAV